VSNEITANIAATPAGEEDYISNARKYASLLALGGTALFMVGLVECIITGETTWGFIILPPLMLALGVVGRRDPRVIVALSSRLLFPAELKKRMPPEAKRKGYVAVCVGTAVALLIDFLLFK
jgi:hypothetical protein